MLNEIDALVEFGDILVSSLLGDVIGEFDEANPGVLPPELRQAVENALRSDSCGNDPECTLLG